MLIPSLAASGAATPLVRSKPGRHYAAFEACLTALPQVKPVLTQPLGIQIRNLKGFLDLDSLRSASETLLVGVPSLKTLLNAVAASGAGLMRGIRSLGIIRRLSSGTLVPEASDFPTSDGASNAV